MTPRSPFGLSELAAACGAALEGEDTRIEDADGLDEAHDRAISFVRAGTPDERVRASRARALIVPRDWPHPLDRPALRHENPRYVFALALELLAPPERPAAGVHPSASIADGVEIGDGCSVGPFAVIEKDAVLGDDCIVGPHVVVGRRARIGAGARLDAGAVIYADCEVGARAVVLAGAVVGSDGFGFEPHQGRIHRLHHIGNAIVGADAEIGANTCIDRGTTGSTTVGAHAKLDNLVMIAHNCRIGDGTMIAGQVGVAGSTRVGDGVVIGGATVVRDHMSIGAGSVIGGNSGVAHDVPPKSVWSGFPARDHRETLRVQAAQTRLPELLREVRTLRAEIAELRARLDRP